MIRDTFTDKSTIGKLYLNGEFISHTLELSWKDNKKSVSCVPKGVYNIRLRCARESATRDYLHLLVEDVPNRSYILFHRGNYPKDTLGCILTGMTVGDDPDTILQSKKAHSYLLDTLVSGGMAEKIELIIKNR